MDRPCWALSQPLAPCVTYVSYVTRSTCHTSPSEVSCRTGGREGGARAMLGREGLCVRESKSLRMRMEVVACENGSRCVRE
eukprot:357179-Chlamydomonas_euryale.AAC.5